MKTTIIGFSSLFRREAMGFRKEAHRVCNPEAETSFLLARHCLELRS
jgi:hypothetical protein